MSHSETPKILTPFAGVSEDFIKDKLGEVGQVLHFRLVYDKETGKPKGFGFAEYSDADQAASAVRNLNDTELQGRKLRVDYSNDPAKDDNNNNSSMNRQQNNNYAAPAPSHQPQPNGQNQAQAADLPPLPEGVGLGAHLTAQDAISATVATIPPSQLLDAMQQMQDLARADPEHATRLLTSSPQLTYAILQILVLMKLVDTTTLQSVIAQTAAVPQQPPPPPPPLRQVPPPQQAYSPYPPAQAPYGAVPTPPVQHQYQPPQLQPQPSAAAPQSDRDALLQQVLQMPQAQIDQLSAPDRAQIMALRSSLMQQYAR